MTSCTPIYNLSVIEGDDRPCDVGDTICAIAANVEVQLDRLDSLRQRTADTVPVLKVANTIGQTFVSGVGDSSIPLNFDTVVVDNDNMFNSGFPSTITWNTPGIWLINANLWTHSTGAGGLQLNQTINVIAPSGLAGFGTSVALSAGQNFQSPFDIYSNGSVTFPILAAGDGFVQVSFFPNGTDTVTFFYADASFVWLGDA